MIPFTDFEGAFLIIILGSLLKNSTSNGLSINN